MSIALQCAQAAITIFSGLLQLVGGFSSLPHIIVSAPLSLVDLWQMIAFSSKVFFVIVDYHFVAMSPFCIVSLLDFC